MSTYAALAEDLRAVLRGEVRFDPGSRALYATDASNYRQLPIGVVIPRDLDDVVAAVAVCRRHDVPITGRGGGTSLAGQTCNTAVIFDFSKYVNRIVEVDPVTRTALVEPGVVLDRLRDAAEEHGLTFGPDPATHAQCTLGGMVGNNSCGVHSVLAGKTADNVEALEVLTYDGLRCWVEATSEEELAEAASGTDRRAQIYAGLRDLRDRYADEIRAHVLDIPRQVSGFNLDQLLPERGCQVARALVGTESTCVIVLQARLRLVPSPPQRVTLVLGYADGAAAADAVGAVMAHRPVGLEGFDDVLVSYVNRKGLHPGASELLPAGGGWLLAEFGADTGEEARARAQRCLDTVDADGAILEPAQAKLVWAVRESGLGAAAHVPGEGDFWPGWEDAAVPPDRLGGYLRDFRALLDRYGYSAALYGHFGQGCVHTRIDFDLASPDGRRRFRAFLHDAADLVVAAGGSLSGEHGDGQARAELLERQYGERLVRAFGEFKALWDPAGRMNPGKVVAPYRVDEHLRLGDGFAPVPRRSHFALDLSAAANRCVGVGKCRKTDAGNMCPSYMATREEKHSTRGRARLLFELLDRSDSTISGWRDDDVAEALDLCLSCKACKAECPVDVDMATYKAEFLAHHYAGRLRPAPAYSMGLVMYWLRAGSLAPPLANAVGNLGALKRLGGVEPSRRTPKLAGQTFRRWFARHGSGTTRPRPRGRVLLWPDTWTDHFHPEVGRAAVDVLAAAGYEVTLPRGWVCCGRPLYDHGLLGRARALLLQLLDVVTPEIIEGVPVVVLEPSCASVLRDEMGELLPNDQRARRLAAATVTLAELLDRDDVVPPGVRGRALVQGHCHDKSVLGFDTEPAVLRRAGLELDVLDAGCCGMAGAFGFTAGHYDVSRAVGERRLLPAVRAAAPSTRIIADGFSCREQIAQETGRRAEHLAQVLASALPH